MRHWPGAQSEINDTVAFGATVAALEEGPAGEVRQAMEDWQAADSALNAAITEFAGLGGLVDTDLPLRDLLEAVDQTLAQRGRLADWTRWVAIRNKAKAAGLTPLVDAIEADQLKGDPVAECRRAYARWWLPLAMDASDPLRQFAHWEHEDIVAAFRKLDDEVAEHAPREVMRRIHHSLPARDGVPRKSELGVFAPSVGAETSLYGDPASVGESGRCSAQTGPVRADVAAVDCTVSSGRAGNIRRGDF